MLYGSLAVGRRWYSGGPAGPRLKVLFFGSDLFSVHSLNKLIELKQARPNIVADVAVVSRPLKRSGRGRSVLKMPPLVERAQRALEVGELVQGPLLCDSREELVCDLYPLVTKSGYNMLVAVSYGQLIPAALVDAAKYSLNVHPSLLPRYRGSSPIQRTLLNGDAVTGVTLQTLHRSKFDQGGIVSQSGELSVAQLLQNDPPQGIRLPKNTAILMDQLGVLGADMLAAALVNGSYTSAIPNSPKYKPSLARKIVTEDKRAQWTAETAGQLVDKYLALGPVHTFIKTDTGAKRVILHDIQLHPVAELIPDGPRRRGPGCFELDESGESIIIQCAQNTRLQVGTLQLEGFAQENVPTFLRRLKKRCGIADWTQSAQFQ
ncbi:methionyl-tRNA formyltransferase KNAG_0C02940 [Huiozyma naganishii CBS 8797]|uniref:Methionyl-tRNA formyltransferase, mitochondrial n=1 Tax=Huiozyma naganishii (strain ATCC MYA-139 / BCRC 22969 / CBS 8797 / KCTC 17520 / NBRC 10181 / NCYC 3082 / Yp74L-3) TaxID=1071383 RepID=J7R3J6_HUIN7|nr:hypothetical protein KNAG_0C02940 [Kazachstania naganishii CBS 8797]CCK69405.1 hypothetical protein KNAG_0C02940 [Kazachstania naganishii CBS 8797]